MLGEALAGRPRRGLGARCERARRAALIPAVQAAAVAAGGFVAGAAVVGLVHRRHQRSRWRRRPSADGSLARGGGARGGRRAGELLQIVGSRSLLVDVHLLGGAGRRSLRHGR